MTIDMAAMYQTLNGLWKKNKKW